MKIYPFLILLFATSLNAFYFEVPEDHIGFKLSLPSFETSGQDTERFNKLDIYFTVSEQNLESEKSDWDSGNSAIGDTWFPEYATYYGNELRWQNFAIDVDVDYRNGFNFSGSITEDINVSDAWNGNGPNNYMIWLNNNSHLEDNSEALISANDLSISNVYSWDSFWNFSISETDYSLSFLGLPHFTLQESNDFSGPYIFSTSDNGNYYNPLNKAFISVVPEPSTYALILGAVALGFAIRKQNSTK
jgi:hypothetical protein